MRGLSGRLRGDRAEALFEYGVGFWGRIGLEYKEREGMRQGIRVEFPFYDRELAALLSGVPPRVRSSPGSTKLVMREAMFGFLPESVRAEERWVFAEPVFYAAVGRYDGEHRVAEELARRYAAVWRMQCAELPS